MIPSTIARKLSALRRGEASLRLMWGIARWVAFVLVLLALACLTDWAIDRHYETPWPLRLLLFIGQIGVGLVIAFLWLVKPLTGKLSATHMALMVEEKTPMLRHRLISVVQFHQPNAQTGGMSRELIVRVTEETEAQTAPMHFGHALDKRRVGWSFGTLAPVLILAAIPLLLWPSLVVILLQRQLLLNVEIPRTVYLAADNPTVWPKGEDIVLKFRVTGEGWQDYSVGQVRIDPEGQPSMYFDLEYESDNGRGEAIFVTPPKGKRDTVKLPTLSHITYRAWLADGRTPNAAELKFEPRPVVDSQFIRAWVLLPEYCQETPSGKPYQIEQPRGEIVALPGASARVHIKIQKPVTKATLQLLGPAPLDTNPAVIASLLGLTSVPSSGLLSASALTGVYAHDKNIQQQLLGAEILLREIPMALSDDKQAAETVFTLPATASGYRLIVEDEYGFKNIPAPRRGIRIVPEEPPQVAMLPTLFDVGLGIGSAEDFPMDGLPIPPNGKIRIAYTCNAPFGLGMAVLHFRVMKLKTSSADGSTDLEPTPWEKLKLYEVLATPKAGPFQLHRGIFLHSKDDEQIQFHAVPSANPELVMGRKTGGGRFDFHTAKILYDRHGGSITLQAGDQIEYKIEVFSAWPLDTKKEAELKAKWDRPSGMSETRVVSVVTEKEWLARMVQYEQEVAKLRKLKGDQGKVFP